MITQFAIVTLVFFFLSTIFVIKPLSFHVPLPFVGKHKVTTGLMTAPTMAVALLWASQCLGATQIQNGIVGTDSIKPYTILILFISLAYMVVSLDINRSLQAAALWVSDRSCSRGRKLYFYFYLLLTFVSIFTGKDPVILSGAVFLVSDITTGLNPDAWLISEFAAANTASMVQFAGNPTNVIVCEGFQIDYATFTKHMILPFVACSIVCYLALMFQYRNEKHVPRTLNVPEHPNPREILRVPFNVIFGAIWLVTCLIVAIALSPFHVEVWKVVLPFAGGKFIFDMSWDHWNYSKDDDLYDPTATVGHYDMLDEHATTDTLTPDPLSDIPSLDNSRDNIHPDDSQPITSPRRPESTSLAIPSLNNTLLRVQDPPTPSSTNSMSTLAMHFPTFFTALPRLPFGLIPFVFSQFILIEALEHQGWINIFARCLVTVSNKQTKPVIWLVGVFGVILCNISGTNIGATILLTKIIRASDFPESTARAAAVSLAVASNIGAVSFTFSASLWGLLWVAILKEKGVELKQWRFAMWNALPLVAMTSVGLGVVSVMRFERHC